MSDEMAQILSQLKVQCLDGTCAVRYCDPIDLNDDLAFHAASVSDAKWAVIKINSAIDTAYRLGWDAGRALEKAAGR